MGETFNVCVLVLLCFPMYCVCVCVVYNRTLVIGTKQGSLVGGEVGGGEEYFSHPAATSY